MAPALFLFLMQAFYTTLRTKWIETHGPTPLFRYQLRYNQGRLLQQPNPTKTKGTPFEHFASMFVDNGAFIFTTYEDITQGTHIIREHLKRFGLLMHVGIPNTCSKTKAMYIPANGTRHTQAAPDTMSPTEEDTDDNANASSTHTTTPPLPPNIDLPDGSNVHFTHNFKYLGAIITTKLDDETEITRQVGMAANQVGALQNFFPSPASMHRKIHAFLATCLNTALYGCESWTLTARSQRKITSFFHTSLRRIMRINMQQVQEFRIRNELIRNKFLIANPLDTIIKRQHQAIGSMARLDL